MVCSNEPGYYEDGRFGIRVENLVVVEEADTEFRWGWGGGRWREGGGLKEGVAGGGRCRARSLGWTRATRRAAVPNLVAPRPVPRAFQACRACPPPLHSTPTTPDETRFGGTTFLKFRRLTLVPIQTKLIEPSLMTAAEIAWLDDYHKEVGGH
jgi:Xaa-Pro aminopeptidase